MPASPAPADPGRDDDLAWLDRDPMTAAEREACLNRLCEQDEGYREDEADEYGGFEPFTAQELATPSATAAPGPDPAVTGNVPAPARPDKPGSRSPRPAATDRPAGTAPGGCVPPVTDRT
jgi:hypothetical protein